MILTEEVVGDWRLKIITSKHRPSWYMFKRLLEHTLSSVGDVIWMLLEPAAELDKQRVAADQLDVFEPGAIPWVRSLVDSSRSYVVNVGIVGHKIVLFYKTVVSAYETGQQHAAACSQLTGD
jgi:hypothetical protein